MDARNKYLVNTIRIVFGLFMIFSGVGGFYSYLAGQGIPESMVATTNMLWDTGLFQMIKVTEIVAGLMLVVGFLPALAAIFLAPICIGVLVFNGMTSPANLPMGMVITVLNGYLGFVYWDKFKALFER